MLPVVEQAVEWSLGRVSMSSISDTAMRLGGAVKSSQLSPIVCRSIVDRLARLSQWMSVNASLQIYAAFATRRAGGRRSLRSRLGFAEPMYPTLSAVRAVRRSPWSKSSVDHGEYWLVACSTENVGPSKAAAKRHRIVHWDVSARRGTAIIWSGRDITTLFSIF
jgi:hypothetical protein